MGWFNVLNALGFGSMVVVLVTYLIQRKQDARVREDELREKRYRCILLLMYAYLTKDLQDLREHRPKLCDEASLKRELETEWVNSWLFGSDEMVSAFHCFLHDPAEESFAETVLCMRRD